MTDINQLAEQLVNLSVKEVNDLSGILKDKHGIEPALSAAPVAAAATQGETAAPTAQEKAYFNIILTNAGAAKINVVKAVKEITGLGLKEAKELVDVTGSTIKDNVSKEEAEKIKKQLEEIGATVEMK